MSIGKTILAWAVCCFWAVVCPAQDLSPRFYWPAPKGTQVLVFGYLYSSGDVLMDPSQPTYGVDSRISTCFFSYLQTLNLWGRTANLVVEVPYSWGTTKGLLFEESARRDFSGFNDLGLTLEVNVLGAPTMDALAYQNLREDPHPILGASVKVLVPTGQYDKDRLVNIGTNRWMARAELGSVIPLGSGWLLEFEAGVWFFGDDDDFLQGKREQEPIFAMEAHVVKRFKPGFWLSLEANYFIGGRQTVGGDQLGDVQRNSRFGATLVVPFRGRNSIKASYNRGVVTEFGTDFNNYLVSYQRRLR